MEPAKSVNPRILTINGGSSSIKFAMFEGGRAPGTPGRLQRLLSGSIERIGLPDATFRVKGFGQMENFSRTIAAADHTAEVSALMDWIEQRIGRDALAAVGHRVVHGGPKYSEPTLMIAKTVCRILGSGEKNRTAKTNNTLKEREDCYAL